MCFFFFKQKTAYEMRISDWSSDVCSSDLGRPHADVRRIVHLSFYREDVFAVPADHHVVDASRHRRAFLAVRQQATTDPLAGFIVAATGLLIEPADTTADLLQHGVIRMLLVGRCQCAKSPYAFGVVQLIGRPPGLPCPTRHTITLPPFPVQLELVTLRDGDSAFTFPGKFDAR